MFIFQSRLFQSRLFRSLAIVFGAISLLAYSASTAKAVDWSTKHQPRVGPNLVLNSEFDGAGDWFLSNGATYDSGVSRSTGSGSMRLFAPGEKVQSFFPSQVQVTPGETYTFSAYSRANTTNGFPPPIVRMYYSYRSATGLFLGNSPNNSTRWGNSKTGEWEEMTTFIQVPDQINGTPVERIELQLFTSDTVEGVNREVWVDDIYFGQGRGFEQAPTPKTAFNGKQTRVDELGNMEVLKSGNWEPFFPLAMYGDNSRPNWSDYSNQGFNMEMRAMTSGTVNKAAAAGMLSGIDISRFVIPGLGNYNDVALIESRIADFKAQGLMDDIALYYWDNEVSHSQWDGPVAITDAIKAADVDANGDRLHPIYMLNGQSGVARRYQNDQVHISDITGSYIGGDNGNPRGRTDNFRILDNTENQRQPSVFAQINRGVGIEMRPRLFGAIAHGARGMGMWRDTYSTPSLRVENLPWWDDFPSMAAEIDQMMDAGLIQMQHWTEWSIDTDQDLIDFGTRDLNGEGYLIASNYNDTSEIVTFTLDGLGYTPVEIRDFFTDTIVATLTGDQFDITLPANGSGVYRLVAPAANNLGDFDVDLDVDGADFLLWQRDTSLGVLSEWQTNFGTAYSSLAASEAVPEPSALLLLLAGTFYLRGLLGRTSC